MLDRQLGRHQLAAQQRADAEARRHLREAGHRLPVGLHDAHVFRPQPEVVGRPIDAKAYPGNRDTAPDTSALEGRFDIGNQLVELDRPLHQPPHPEPRCEDQDGSDRACPSERVMRVPADMANERAAAPPLRLSALARIGLRPRFASAVVRVWQ